MKFVATKKGMTTNFFYFSLLLLFLDPGSEIRDPGSGIRDPGSEIRDPGSEIRDPGWVKIRIRDKHPGSATLIFYCFSFAFLDLNPDTAMFYTGTVPYTYQCCGSGMFIPGPGS